MRNTVIWDEALTDELMMIWMHAADRHRVADASNQIDIFLRSSPEKGQNLGPYYRLRLSPLEVHYTYSPDDCLVKVTYLELVG